MTGSSLLAGATLSEGVGIFMLGAAFAWLIGSETASRTYHYLRSIPGKTWPWLRVLLLMAFGGCLLVAVAVWFNFNWFLVAAAMGIFAMLISSLAHFPTQRLWLQFTGWGLAIAVFFLASLGATTLNDTAQQHDGDMGRLAVDGLIALPIGMLWLAKGWRLILAGINAQQATDGTQVENAGERRGTNWLYVSLFAGTIFLSLWLGALTFIAFSQSVFPSQVRATPKPSNPPNPLGSAVVGFMLLTWWPYASWKSILRREPNTTLDNVKRHKRVTIGLGAFFSVILSVAITFGIQNGNDAMATAQLEEGKKDFQDVAEKIGAIKSRDLRTPKDYIEAYEEIQPLLDEFDAKLRHFSGILSEAKQRDRNRGPVNIRHLYGSEHKEQMVWSEQVFDLIRQDIELTRKQVQVARQMAALPEELQVEFWNMNFRPLVEQEGIIRQKLAALMSNVPAGLAK